MIELIKYFRILFLSTKISRERLKGFCEDHIQRLAANNPGGIFTTILTDVTNAYNAYYGDLSSEVTNLAVKEGKTIAMNESRGALEVLIGENEPLVKYTYRSDKDKYEEFYPLGVREYRDADLSTFETITLRYKNVLASHAADFPAGFVTDYNTAQALFVTNRNAQSTAKSAVDTERSDMATTRPALALQLTTNLLTIALEYVGDESKCAIYFDQTMLDAAFRESERKVSSEIDPGVLENIFDNVTKGEIRITIKNTGEVALDFGFTSAADAPFPGKSHLINPGQEESYNAAELGWTSVNKFLNVMNNEAQAGSYTVEKN
jgi:hypothetical protein